MLIFRFWISLTLRVVAWLGMALAAWLFAEQKARPGFPGNAVSIVLCLVIVAMLSGFWWLLPILFFAIVMCETGRGLIINKSKSGFPYLEATDAIGLFIAVVFWGFISLVWFIIAVTQ